MATLTVSRYRPKNQTEDRIRISVDTKLLGSYIWPTHTLRMLALLGESEMVHQVSVAPPSEPGANEWVYEYTVRLVDRD